MRRTNCAVFFILSVFLNLCFCELTAEKKQKFLNGFIDSLNNLPDQPYIYEDGVLLDAQKIDSENGYIISVRLKTSDIHNLDTVKFFKCTGSVVDLEENGVTVQSGHRCAEDLEGAGIEDDSTTSTTSTTEPAETTGPVRLYNEVQYGTEITSGEQFVAIPRNQSITPCKGCASHVDPNAVGVSEMAHLGIRHLDLHDPLSKHTLQTVVDVERQVQVVNGVRYILTLLVNYNNCTASDAEPCPITVPCKISILEKPWKKLPGGSKYRAIIANNCTLEWQFGDEGEVLPAENNNENNELYPDPSNNYDDDLKVIHNFDVQAQPNQEKPITDEMIKNIEAQIIPRSEFTTPERHLTVTPEPILISEHTENIHKDEMVINYYENSAPAKASHKNEPNTLSDDKKQAIDDIVNFFDFAGLHKPDTNDEHQRSKRSYENDLKMRALAKKFKRVKKYIDNANYVQSLAQTMVDYLNELDLVVKNRMLKDVLVAEDEVENNQHFFYLQVSTITPCDKTPCPSKDNNLKICNGVVDNTNEKIPQVLSAFCYDDDTKPVLKKVETVTFDDPVLVKLAKKAFRKIELESTKKNAMKILRILDATTQKASGTLTRLSMSLAYTNCNKSLDLYKRTNCIIIEDMGAIICEVAIHEKKKVKDMKISYHCSERGVHESFTDTVHFKNNKQSFADPEILNMANEALQNLEIQSNRNNKQKIVEIKSVSTKVIAGLLTHIVFSVGYTNCFNEKVVDLNTCHLLSHEPLRHCEAQVWDRPWLEDGRQLKVKCDDMPYTTPNDVISESRKKRSLHFVGGNTEQDPSKPEYKTLAEESLEKYLQNSGTSLTQKVIKVTRVRTQVVSGSKTEIDFEVHPLNGDVFSCHSEVWEQPWINKKEIEVKCNSNDKQTRVERQVPGGNTDQDPNDPKYKTLAEESLQKYFQNSGTTLTQKIIKVTKVTTQVVSGTNTDIDFEVHPLNGDIFTCHSKVWEQTWLKKKEIEVVCDLNDKQTRVKKHVVGGKTEQDPSDPIYKTLAEESLQKYLQNSGTTLTQKNIKVTKVKTQVVSGTNTEIDFEVHPLNGDIFTCHSKVWEQTWLNKKEINVDCDLNDKQTRVKRQIPGGKTEQDPSDPKYKTLAEESLQKYLQNSGTTLTQKIIKVTKVKTQVVSGTNTEIDFEVHPLNGDIFTCHSKVWEQSWLNKKEINVDCDLNDKQTRVKRQVPGGKTEQDPSDPKYKTLAEESLQKYLQNSGTTLTQKYIKITRVTNQVVSGTNTEIDFEVHPLNGDIFTCHSKVWEQSWLNKKEINVDCDLNDKQTRVKRQVPGGKTEQDPSDPKYKTMAEESLQKYLQNSGTTLTQKYIKITRVTNQVVSGTNTEIDFEVHPLNGDVFSCHSKVWEQTWLNKKEINVDCDLNDKQTRVKRQVPGGKTEQDPSDPKYKTLAEESLQKYLQNSGTTLTQKIIKVTKVKTQVVSGTNTEIDFEVHPLNGDIFTCHSKVWEQSWLNKKEINVDCDLNDKQTRVKRQVKGGKTEQDPSDPKYKTLAEESLQKYLQNSGRILTQKVIKVTKVTTQVVSGTNTEIDFEVHPLNGDIFTCHSKVWEQPWLKNKDITVDCSMNESKRQSRAIARGDGHSKRGSPRVDDPNKPEYKILADQSLHKYMKLQDEKVHHKVIEVKRVVAQVVAGNIYEIDFTASPTTCSVDDSNLSKCTVKNETVLYCHTRVWSRPWLKSNKIDVSCNSDISEGQTDDDNNEEFERKRRKAFPVQYNPKDNVVLVEEIVKKGSKKVGAREENVDKEEYRDLTKEVVQKYEKLSNAKYMHKITKIHRVFEEVNEGIMTSIEFSISPTICQIGNDINVDSCKIKHPEIMLSCVSSVWERTWIYLKDIKVSCKKKNTKYLKPLEWDDEIPGTVVDGSLEREKRQVEREDDDYIDDDIKFYYADRAIKHLNEKSHTHNLQKLITIHAMDETNQMGARMVRMYIETAVTYCLRRQNLPDLTQCDEIEGTGHNLCHIRLWPLPEDDLIVQHVAAVCDDERDFLTITGLDIPLLISTSIKEVEKSPSVQFKLIHQGEPYIIPSLSSKNPIKINFVVVSTNCSKDVDVFKNRDICYVDNNKAATTCQSVIGLAPDSMAIVYVKAKCNAFDRKKRSVTFNPANNTSDDMTIAKLVEESLQKLEGQSSNQYKQRVMQINSYTTKIKRGRETTIDFDIGYTSCLKYEYVSNISTCEFIDHLPRRHCISHILERLWVDNGRNIDVICEDDETRLEQHIEYESAEKAMELANEALKHIEAKYPHPNKLKVTRIFSLEKQALAGIHYRMKLEVGFTDCLALSVKSDCKLKKDGELNRFCRVNVWIRPWTNHPPNFRVSCDYQEGLTADIYQTVQSEYLFYDFITTYRPGYMEDDKEMMKRFKIFSDNVKKVHELNVHERGTARYAITRFSDLTYEEFSSKFLGLKPGLKSANDIPMIEADIPKLRLPEQFDWRDHGAVTAVKDQGSCGSCWAFSVTGNIEGQWKLQTGKLMSLSEQELVDCDKLDQGCNGGLMDNAYRAVEELGGLETEGDYPYEGEVDKCAFNKTMSKVQISGAVNISSNETDMAKWLVGNGPISIGINANAMQFYVGGISHPWKYLCSHSNLDHGVLIVGFGVKDYPLFHKRLPYWIVKNSWGSSWGEQGYYRVYRGDGTCGLNQMASSAVV